MHRPMNQFMDPGYPPKKGPRWPQLRKDKLRKTPAPSQTGQSTMTSSASRCSGCSTAISLSLPSFIFRGYFGESEAGLRLSSTVRVSILAIPRRADLLMSLFQEIAARDLAQVEHCLVEGQCANMANGAGVQPLHAAINAHLEDVALTLLQASANVHIPYEDVGSPLHLASSLHLARRKKHASCRGRSLARRSDLCGFCMPAALAACKCFTFSPELPGRNPVVSGCGHIRQPSGCELAFGAPLARSMAWNLVVMLLRRISLCLPAFPASFFATCTTLCCMQVTYHIPVALSTHGGATSFGQAYQSLHVAHASLQEGISLSPTLPDAMCVCLVWTLLEWAIRGSARKVPVGFTSCWAIRGSARKVPVGFAWDFLMWNSRRPVQKHFQCCSRAFRQHSKQRLWKQGGEGRRPCSPLVLTHSCPWLRKGASALQTSSGQVITFGGVALCASSGQQKAGWDEKKRQDKYVYNIIYFNIEYTTYNI